MSVWRRYRRVVALSVISVSFFFIGRALYQSWSKVPFEEIRFSAGYLLVAFVFQFLFYILGATAWVMIVRTLGFQLPFRKGLQITSAANIGRYIPGKLWAFLGQAYFASREGVPMAQAVLSVLLRTVLSVLSALLVFSISTVFLVHRGLPKQIYFALMLIPLCLIALHPRALRRIVNWGLRRLGKASIEFDFDYLRTLSLVGVYFSIWVVHSVNMFFLIRSFYPLPLSVFLPLVGINAMAWIIGFLSLPVPGGLGVREGILVTFLQAFMPLPVSIISALLARVWAILGMLVFFGVFVGILRGWKDMVSGSRGLQSAQEEARGV